MKIIIIMKIPWEVTKFDFFYLRLHTCESALNFFCKNSNDNMHFKIEIDEFSFKPFVAGDCYEYFDFIERESFMNFMKKYRKYLVGFHLGRMKRVCLRKFEETYHCPHTFHHFLLFSNKTR